MDSKLKKTALMTSLCMIALIGGLVVFLNRESRGRGLWTQPVQTAGPGQETATQKPQDGQETVANGQIGNDLNAFLRDDTFFDPEKNPYMEELLEESGRLNLLVNSVERDLRIQITNRNGEPVTGEGFLVTVEGAGEYKDLDKDGVIYIADLEPGEYEVSMAPVDGYKVSGTSVRVRVKAKVEYLPIEDIGLLIKQEEEVDAEAEDTSFTAAIESGDNTQITGLQETYGNTVIGMDVSSAQGEIDWDKIREAGVEYVIIRTGYRGAKSGCLVEDPCFEQYIKGARLAGLSVGVVFRSQAVTEVEAVEEASMVLMQIKDYNITYPVFVDVQGAGGEGRADGLTAEERTALATAFCKTVENAGYKGGVYAADYQLLKELDSEQLENYCIWLAEYRRVPVYSGYYQMWQYTSKGKIAGTKGHVNLNISYLGYE